MKKLNYFIVAAGITSLLLTTPLAVYSESKTVQDSKVHAEVVYETVKHVKTAQQLDDIIAKNENVAADIGATWCGPCEKYDPIFEEVAKDYKGNVVFCKVVLDKIDKQEAGKICNKHKVLYIPKTMLFKNGKEVYSGKGVIEKETLSELIDTNLLKK